MYVVKDVEFNLEMCLLLKVNKNTFNAQVIYSEHQIAVNAKLIGNIHCAWPQRFFCILLLPLETFSI